MHLNGNHIKILTLDENSLLSKISDITNACDCLNNMMANIYLIKKKQFIYCNNAFKKTIGVSCNKFLKGGWNYWFSLIDVKESLQVKNKIFKLFSTPYVRGVFVLRYHITNTCGEKICIRHEIFLYKLKKYTLAISYLSDVTIKEKIEHYFKAAEDFKDFNSSESQIKVISPREKEVLKLIADGYSSKQIADKLFISNHTATSHRKNLIEKFKVRNTAQLIKRASRNIELW